MARVAWFFLVGPAGFIFLFSLLCSDRRRPRPAQIAVTHVRLSPGAIRRPKGQKKPDTPDRFFFAIFWREHGASRDPSR